MQIRRKMLFCLLVFLLTACKSANFPGSNIPGDIAPSEYSAIVVGAPAPNFELQNQSGGKSQLEDYLGQVVILNFWATWCPPCRMEMPTLQDRFVTSNSEFTILAVNYAEQFEVVEEFVDDLGLTFPVLLDSDGAVQELYQIRGYPSSIFVDPDGIIRIIHIGILTENQLDDYLRDLGIGDI